jgi:hypothetical protein
MHPLVVHRPAFPPQQALGHPPAPSDVFNGDLSETKTQLPLLDGDKLVRIAPCAAMLTLRWDAR